MLSPVAIKNGVCPHSCYSSALLLQDRSMMRNIHKVFKFFTVWSHKPPEHSPFGSLFQCCLKKNTKNTGTYFLNTPRSCPSTLSHTTIWHWISNILFFIAENWKFVCRNCNFWFKCLFFHCRSRNRFAGRNEASLVGGSCCVVRDFGLPKKLICISVSVFNSFIFVSWKYGVGKKNERIVRFFEVFRNESKISSTHLHTKDLS